MEQSMLWLTCVLVRLIGHQIHERQHYPPSCTLWYHSCVCKEIHGDGILWESLMAWAISALWIIKSTDLHLTNTWKDKQCLDIYLILLVSMTEVAQFLCVKRSGSCLIKLNQNILNLTVENRNRNQHKQLKTVIRVTDSRHRGQVWGMVSADHVCPLNQGASLEIQHKRHHFHA